MLEAEPLESLRLGAVLRIDQLELVPLPHDQRGSAFGLTQSQSMPRGGSTVPLVSTATSNPSAWSASSRAGSSWSSGSPPVHTTKRLPSEPPIRPGRGHGPRQRRRIGELAAARTVGAHEVGVAEPAGGVRRSDSRPVHRLHPANRQNTAGRPVLAPSPWRV